MTHLSYFEIDLQLMPMYISFLVYVKFFPFSKLTK